VRNGRARRCAKGYLTGPSNEIGGKLTSNPTVRKRTFTGSTKVGKLLMEQCAATVKKTSIGRQRAVHCL
jgi:acyl-CoA reductase-like NAD-dependent aldehyde dehydrogenase